jgi:hypothetical protein
MGASEARFGCASAAAIICFLSSGCASTQLNYNAVEVSSTLDSVYTRETLNNLSKFIDDPSAIPSQVMMNGGTIQTTNTVNPSISFPFVAQVAKTAQAAPAGLTLSSANTLSAVGGNVSATNTATQNYNIAPINDANTLRNQQALYRHAVFGAPLNKHTYHVPMVFFQDKFFPDPFDLQKPHCVLCADQQGVFSGLQDPVVHVNHALPPKWLYWESDPRLSDLLAQGEPVDLGHYGNHELLMSRADFNSGVLTDFVVFTLPNAAPAEVLTAVVKVTPGTPGAAGVSSGSPVSSGTPVNAKIFSPGGQPPVLVVPQGIVPQ